MTSTYVHGRTNYDPWPDGRDSDNNRDTDYVPFPDAETPEHSPEPADASVDESESLPEDSDAAQRVPPPPRSDVDDTPDEAVLDTKDTYTYDDLVALGLDSKVAEYLIITFGRSHSNEQKAIDYNIIELLQSRGILEVNQADGSLGVAVNLDDGYSVYEILETTDLSIEEAETLIYEINSGQPLSEDQYTLYISDNGTLTAEGQAALDSARIDDNPLDAEGVQNSLDAKKAYTPEELLAFGLPQSVVNYLTREGSTVTGQDLIDMVQNHVLQGGMVDGQLKVKVIGSLYDVPANGLSLLALISSGLPADRAEWLVMSFGEDGRLSSELIGQHIDINTKTLKPDTQKQYDQLMNATETELTGDGSASHQDLIALGFSSAQAQYLISNFGDYKNNRLSTEQFEHLKKQGFIVPDPERTNPQRYRLQGENGVSDHEAQQQAQAYAGNKAGTNEPVIHIAPDGTGDFFVAGQESAIETKINPAQSVIFTPTRNEDGSLSGQYDTYGGDEQGLYDRETLLALGFTEEQIDALFEHARGDEAASSAVLNGDGGEVVVSTDSTEGALNDGDTRWDRIREHHIPEGHALEFEIGSTHSDDGFKVIVGDADVQTLLENGYELVFSGENGVNYYRNNETGTYYVDAGLTNADSGNSLEDYIKNIGKLVNGDTGAGSWEVKSSRLISDPSNPATLTMSEIRDAIADDVSGVSAVADIIGQSIVMRKKGEPSHTEGPEEPSPFAPTQIDARWLNDTYGGGDGLTDEELAEALEAGVVQIVDGQVLMTAYGKAMAFEAYGPSDGNIDAEQEDILDDLFRSFFPNSNELPPVDVDTLMSMYDGKLSRGDAILLIASYGDGKIITKEQLRQAIVDNAIILSERTEGEHGSQYSIKITPSGYENMAEVVLADKDNQWSQQVHGILNYPDRDGATSISMDELIEVHGLSNKDALALIAHFDRNHDNALDARELLKALMSGSVTLDEQYNITAVDIQLDGSGTIGPYDYEALQEKIQSDEPPAADIAAMIMLDLGKDPNNPNATVTDAEIEEYLRTHRNLVENPDGTLSMIPAPETPADADAAWDALNPGKDGVQIAYGEGGRNQYRDHLLLSQGDQFGLAMYLREHNIGEVSGNWNYVNLTKKDFEKLFKDGILTVNENGQVTLTKRGETIIEAQQAHAAMALMAQAESEGRTDENEVTGDREMDRDGWKDLNFGGGENVTRDRMYQAGHRGQEDEAVTLAGIWYALQEGFMQIHPQGNNDKNEDIGYEAINY